MYNFFVEESARTGESFQITGADYNHIRNVLRMHPGDVFLVSCSGQSHLCRLESFGEDTVMAAIQEENYQDTELGVELYLFQGLPKSDKMELIIQKAVELGAAGVIPVEMLTAISCGAVFMGANSYIGNAPNFMVKAISDENGVNMPSFFGYLVWSFGILIPVFLLDSLLFFL